LIIASKGDEFMSTVKTFAKATLIMAAAAVSTSAMAQQVGDWVLSPWRGSRVLYPGVIESRSGTTVTVRFDDGTSETRQASTMRVFDWQAGSRIACQWSDDQWYNAVILSLSSNGYNMRIRYDDDATVEDTTTGKCRTR
jgi:hypothetical protein